jgi:SAM-dependent methyltransferase
LFELYGGLAGQGPGSDDATLAALAGIHGLPARPDILDIGCGTGRQTLALAGATGGFVTAVDTHQPFLDELAGSAAAMGLSENIRTINRPVDAPGLEPACFDLIWSEGAACKAGFSKALRAWRRLLRPGGSMAVTELCWLTEDPPADARSFWAGVYPAMKSVRENLRVIAEEGYYTADALMLPGCPWWEDYYLMMEKRIKVLRQAYKDDRAMQDGLDKAEKGMGVYRRCSGLYGYVFFIMGIGSDDRP